MSEKKVEEKKLKNCPFHRDMYQHGSDPIKCSEDCALYLDDRSMEKAGRCAFFWLTLKLQDIGGLLESIKEILNKRFGSP